MGNRNVKKSKKQLGDHQVDMYATSQISQQCLLVKVSRHCSKVIFAFGGRRLSLLLACLATVNPFKTICRHS